MSDLGSGTTATGYLLLDASGVAGGVNQAISSLNQLNSISGQAYFGLRNLGLGLELVGDTAAAALGLAARAAVDWEAQQAAISEGAYDNSISAQQNSQAMAGVTAQLKAMASTMPVNIGLMNQTAAALANQGIAYQDIAGDTQTIVELNKVTGDSVGNLVSWVTKLAGATGLGSAGVRDAASSIVELQRQTRASVSDIESLSNRLFGAGEMAGLSTPDILGLSAAISVVPQNARLAGFGFQTFITDVSSGVAKGGIALQTLSQLTGQTAEQFRQAWGKDSAQALAEVVTKLGDLKDNEQAQLSVLQALGITQARQVSSTIAVADAQAANAGTANDMSNAIHLANEAWRNGTALQDDYQRMTNTTSAQLQILHNNVTLAGQAFGADFLPVLNPIIKGVDDLLFGIQSLSPGIRAVVEVTTLAVAALGVFGGAFLILLPRAIQAWSGLQAVISTLRGTGEAAAAGAPEIELWNDQLARVSGIALADAEAEGLTNAQLITFVSTAIQAAGVSESLANAMAEEAITTTAAGDAALVATPEVATLGTAMNLALFGLPALVGLLTLLTAHLVESGAAHRAAAQESINQQSADEQLATILKSNTKDIQDQTNAWIFNTLAKQENKDGTANMLTLLQGMGLTAQQIADIVSGNLTPAEQQWIDQMTAARNAGDKLWNSLSGPALDALVKAHDQFQITIQQVKAFEQASKDAGGSTDSAGNSIDKTNQKLKDHQVTADQAGAAAERLASDELAVTSSANALVDAEQKVADAEDAVAQQAVNLQEAQDTLTASQDAQVVAADKLVEAEQKLANARQDAALTVQQANEAVQQSDLRQQQATLRVAEAQAALNKLQQGTAPLDLEKATNALADANLRLLDSQQGVSDAQWQLNYLLEEGASARDIHNAQTTLADAQQKAADAATSQTDAQNKLRTAQQGALPIDLTKATLDLKQAQLDQQGSAESAQQAQQKLYDAEAAQASDTAYHQAVLDVATAHDAVDRAAQQTHTDLRALQLLESGKPERDLRQAELDLESAVLQHANAIVTLNVDQLTANGTYVDGQTKARMLGDTLSSLATNMSGPVAGAVRTLAGEILANTGKVRDMNAALDPGASSALAKILDGADKSGKALDGLAGAHGRAASAASHHKSYLDELTGGFQSIWYWIDQAWHAVDHLVQSLGGLAAGAGKGLSDFFSGKWLPSVPFLATGGLITGPTLLVAGEGGSPEVLLPTDDVSRAMDLLGQSGLLDKFAAAGGIPIEANVLGAAAAYGGMPSYVAPGATPPSGGPGGDTYILNTLSSPEPEDIVGEFMWSKMTRSRR